MIHTTKFKSDLRNREILPESFSENLFVCIKASLERYAHRCIPWHWHDTFEIDYVVQGEMELRTPDSTRVVRQGDVLFVNHSVMHEFNGIPENPAVVYAILVDMHFLSGVYNGVLERRYILPVKESGIECYSFSPDSDTRLAMARAVLNAVELLKDEPEGYELQLRSELSSFWIGLLQETKELRKNTERTGVADKERIKTMLEFIHTSYAEKLSVEQIAASAGVSVRECNRCFDRCVGKPPVKYLTDYRLHVAAEKLLDTDATILEISEACGFSTPSYFGKCFSSAMGCTPKEYRYTGGVLEREKRKKTE